MHRGLDLQVEACCFVAAILRGFRADVHNASGTRLSIVSQGQEALGGLG